MKVGRVPLVFGLAVIAVSACAKYEPNTDTQPRQQSVFLTGYNNYYWGFTAYIADQWGNVYSGRVCQVRNIGPFQCKIGAKLFVNKDAYLKVDAFASNDVLNLPVPIGVSAGTVLVLDVASNFYSTQSPAIR